MKKNLILIMITFAVMTIIACTPNMSDDDDDGAPNEDDDDAADDDATDDDDTAEDDDTGDDDDSSDTIPPYVVDSSPAVGEVELKLATAVVIEFSEAMDSASVESAFTLGDEEKSNVSGTFAWDDENEAMTFTPDDNLVEDKGYTAMLGTGAMDTAGNPMENEFLLDFETVNLWTRTYNGASDGEDIGHGIALDDHGNVYVTGEEWVTGEYTNIWTRKYDKDGEIEWTETYNGDSGMRDIGYAIALDSDSNIMVAGFSRVTGESDNVWLRKHDPDGDEIWTVDYNGPDNGYDVAHGVGVDSSGNVYVAGYETAVEDNRNIWVAKFGPNGGDPTWSVNYDGADQGTDGGIAIAVDEEGNVFATGYEYTTDEDNNIWLRKYNTEGQVKWTRRYNGILGGSDVGKGIAIDKEGNILVTGYETIEGNGRNIWVRKYNSMGYEIWTDTYDGEQDEDEGHDIEIDDMNNIIVVGYVHLPEENQNIFVRKYNEEGTILWTETYNDDTNGDDVAAGVAADEHGNLYVTGCVTVADEETNIWLRKYDPDGNYSEE